MSILIKGIDMPKNGDRHRITIYDNGDAYITTSNRLYETDRKDVEVVEIPTPHGRLIDADKLKEKRETMCWKDEFYMTHESDFIDSRYIANAPTILEAEE